MNLSDSNRESAAALVSHMACESLTLTCLDNFRPPSAVQDCGDVQLRGNTIAGNAGGSVALGTVLAVLDIVQLAKDNVVDPAPVQA